MIFPALFLSVLFILVTSTPADTADRWISRGDLAGLYNLRASLSIESTEWNPKTNPCFNWNGVVCRSGRVISLDLTGLRRARSGRLKTLLAVDSVRNLTALERLVASGLFLPGPISIWFDVGVLPPSLNVLILCSASVSGDIPFFLGGVDNFRVLSLSGNSLSGNIPPTIGDLTNLSSLDLSSNFLTGSIPPELSKLRNLSYLNLSSNFLSGAIPPSLGMLGMLKVLALAGNSLYGILPAQLANILSLETLDLSSNSLVGDLPAILPTNLRFVNLSHNGFSGRLPNSTWSLSEFQLFDVSRNNVTGVLPDLALGKTNATGAVINLSSNVFYGLLSPGVGEFFQRFNTVDLSNNYFLGEPLNKNGNIDVYKLNCFSNAMNQRSTGACDSFYIVKNLSFLGHVAPPPLATSFSTKKSSERRKSILLGVLGGLVVIATSLLTFFCLKRTRKQNAKPKVSMTIAVLPKDRKLPALSTFPNSRRRGGESFTYEQLVQATSDFSSINLIKHGHSGDLYHGILQETISVVVKRIDVQVVKREAYLVEMDLFSKDLNGRLVPFVGHCLEKDNEKFLVYNFMQYADLSKALHSVSGSKEEKLQPLDWITRLKIATSVADALCFLHHECNPPLVHRDIQSTSVLLDDKFEVHLGSLGEVCVQEGESHPNVIARLLERSQVLEQETSGSPATCAYDIYCLGKVFLELITGKPGISWSNDAMATEWLDHTLANINIFEKDLITKIIDTTLLIDDDLMEEVWAMAIIARYCLNPMPHKRPLARHVLRALQNPLKVVREDSFSGSGPLWNASSRSSWIGAFMGSWRLNSSDIVSASEQLWRDHGLMQAGNARSLENSEEFSFT